jgi:small subunit ribosomal protein S20
MANHKATEKDVRKVKVRRERNRYKGKTTRNAIRKVAAIASFDEASKELPATIAMIDKLAKSNIIHKNKAANLKSKLQKKVNALKNEVVAPKVVAKKAAAKKAAPKKAAKKK